MSITELTLEELFAELCDLARDQGISNQESWDNLVEEVVESHMDDGEIDLDDDSEGMKDELRAKWAEYKRELIAEDLGQEEDVVMPEKMGKLDEEV